MGDRPKRVRRVDLGDNPIFTEFLEAQGTARGMIGRSLDVAPVNHASGGGGVFSARFCARRSMSGHPLAAAGDVTAVVLTGQVACGLG